MVEALLSSVRIKIAQVFDRKTKYHNQFIQANAELSKAEHYLQVQERERTMYPQQIAKLKQMIHILKAELHLRGAALLLRKFSLQFKDDPRGTTEEDKSKARLLIRQEMSLGVKAMDRAQIQLLHTPPAPYYSHKKVEKLATW